MWVAKCWGLLANDKGIFINFIMEYENQFNIKNADHVSFSTLQVEVGGRDGLGQEAKCWL